MLQSCITFLQLQISWHEFAELQKLPLASKPKVCSFAAANINFINFVQLREKRERECVCACVRACGVCAYVWGGGGEVRACVRVLSFFRRICLVVVFLISKRNNNSSL